MIVQTAFPYGSAASVLDANAGTQDKEREATADNRFMSEELNEMKQSNEKSAQTGNLSAIQQPDLHSPHALMRELVEEDKEEHEESIRVGLLLTLGIGILNACTYVTRGHVFASSQSGNLLYLGLDLAKGEFGNLTKYLFPPLMFAVGIIIAEHYHDKPNYPQWRKVPFLIEIVLIALATFLPDSWNALANPVFGLCCGLQSIIFKRIRSNPVATIVINSAFQNAVVTTTRFLHLHDGQDAFRSLLYFVVVLAYFGGIVTGALLCPYLGHFVSLISAALLAGCLFIVIPPKTVSKIQTQAQ